mmetsp:Transcript_3206/g.5371  ORF Transcript_3206/g.5371 Transcript_3206/m.5371 type:complete len:614 (+) Transcript_3206:602-2443(+)|eukprot:CAMPEP_0171498532 /NCGR_PEP_ID=MMETSP0958-20121227/7909_1 /TAXON_ID=87120 /ORGANISM="Aurantiochytrium limacinum, Strain ATCCMYA-1381" /LENGTH=613 /DNA_ID=CAMNT_0012032955 /DNA_START=582 /DNA_END=2423 /DNA_ORIENTATION=-
MDSGDQHGSVIRMPASTSVENSPSSSSTAASSSAATSLMNETQQQVQPQSPLRNQLLNRTSGRGFQRVDSVMKGRRELLDHRLFEMRHFDSGEYFMRPREQQKEYLEEIEQNEEIGHHHAHSTHEKLLSKHHPETSDPNTEDTARSGLGNARFSAKSALLNLEAEPNPSPVSSTDSCTPTEDAAPAGRNRSIKSSRFPRRSAPPLPFPTPRGSNADKLQHPTVEPRKDGTRALLERTFRRARRFDSGDFFTGLQPEENIAGTSPPRLRSMRAHNLQVETSRVPTKTASPLNSGDHSSEVRLKRNDSVDESDCLALECGTPLSPEFAVSRESQHQQPPRQDKGNRAHMLRQGSHPRFDSADFFRGALSDDAALRRATRDKPIVREEARRVVLERSVRHTRRFDSADFFAGVPAEEELVAGSPPRGDKNTPPPAPMRLVDEPASAASPQSSSALMAQRLLHKRINRKEGGDAPMRSARSRFAKQMDGASSRHNSVESKATDEGSTSAPVHQFSSKLSNKAVTYRKSMVGPPHHAHVNAEEDDKEASTTAARERLQAEHSPRVHRFDSADYFRGIDADDFRIRSDYSDESPQPYSPPMHSPAPGPSRLRKAYDSSS